MPGLGGIGKLTYSCHLIFFWNDWPKFTITNLNIFFNLARHESLMVVHLGNSFLLLALYVDAL